MYVVSRRQPSLGRIQAPVVQHPLPSARARVAAAEAAAGGNFSLSGGPGNVFPGNLGGGPGNIFPGNLGAMGLPEGVPTWVPWAVGGIAGGLLLGWLVFKK